MASEAHTFMPAPFSELRRPEHHSINRKRYSVLPVRMSQRWLSVYPGPRSWLKGRPRLANHQAPSLAFLSMPLLDALTSCQLQPVLENHHDFLGILSARWGTDNGLDFHFPD